MPKPIGFLPVVGAPAVRPMFRTLAVSASGLSAQRQRIETISSNIANAETTSTAEGGAYRRRVARLEGGMVEAQPRPEPPALLPLPDQEPRWVIPGLRDSFPPPADPGAPDGMGVRVAAIEEDATEGPLVYDPGHPDADAAGYVRYPNVRITDELVELLDARRVYEANATVFQSAKQMLRRAIDI
jgi:flagellar basal-body rod protein FlgC